MKTLKTPSLSARRTRGAFTLIEVLVVIAIIIVLAGLLISVAGFVNEKAGNARAKAEIASLEAAIVAYKQDMGTYPSDSGSKSGNNQSTYVLIQELAVNPIKTPDQYNNRKPYEFPIKMLNEYDPSKKQSYDTVLNASRWLVDPFGNPYYYFFDEDAASNNNTSASNPKTGTTNNGPTYFDLWSYGKNGESGSKNVPAKWIKNW